jgi:hypothetical protein
MPWSQRFTEAAQKLRFDTLDHPRFLSLLSSHLAVIECSATTEEGLDSLAHGLTLATASAYKGSARSSLAQGIGQPWWNIDCRKALQDSA